MGLLDDVVMGAASDAVATPDLLRQLQTLAQQLQSVELRSWARAELTGYLPEHRLPTYRGPFILPVGDGGAEVIELELRGPLAELIHIADLADELRDADAVAAVALYRERVEAGIDPRIALMRLCAESRVVPGAVLRSVDESVRNRILDVTLDLRAVVRDTGDPDALNVSASSLAFILDGALGFAPAADDVSALRGAEAGALVERMAAVLADIPRAEEAARVVLEDEPSAAKRNSVQRLANAVRSGRMAAAPGIHPDDAADRVVQIAARHHNW